MTVEQLINFLRDMPADAPVVVPHWRDGYRVPSPSQHTAVLREEYPGQDIRRGQRVVAL